jgi:hypothetical protein
MCPEGFRFSGWFVSRRIRDAAHRTAAVDVRGDGRVHGLREAQAISFRIAGEAVDVVQDDDAWKRGFAPIGQHQSRILVAASNR